MPLVDATIVAQGCLVFVTVHVSNSRFHALQIAGAQPPSAFNGIGLVDTGASNTLIDKSIVPFLGLQPSGIVPVFSPTTGATPISINEYDVSVWFPQAPNLIQSQVTPHPVHLTLPVTEADFSGQGFHVLIGRDVLARGVLIYNGLSGRFTLAF
jgi:hypothetical protein